MRVTDVAVAQRALLAAAEEMQLERSTVRASSQSMRIGGPKRFYEALMEALLDDPRPPRPDVVAEALYNMTHGSLEVSEACLAALTQVACRIKPGMVTSVAAELDVIELLATA